MGIRGIRKFRVSTFILPNACFRDPGDPEGFGDSSFILANACFEGFGGIRGIRDPAETRVFQGFGGIPGIRQGFEGFGRDPRDSAGIRRDSAGILGIRIFSSFFFPNACFRDSRDPGIRVFWQTNADIPNLQPRCPCPSVCHAPIRIIWIICIIYVRSSKKLEFYVFLLRIRKLFCSFRFIQMIADD